MQHFMKQQATLYETTSVYTEFNDILMFMQHFKT